jgi:hypothetical protein
MAPPFRLGMARRWPRTADTIRPLPGGAPWSLDDRPALARCPRGPRLVAPPREMAPPVPAWDGAAVAAHRRHHPAIARWSPRGTPMTAPPSPGAPGPLPLGLTSTSTKRRRGPTRAPQPSACGSWRLQDRRARTPRPHAPPARPVRAPARVASPARAVRVAPSVSPFPCRPARAPRPRPPCPPPVRVARDGAVPRSRRQAVGRRQGRWRPARDPCPATERRGVCLVRGDIAGHRPGPRRVCPTAGGRG